MNTLNGYSKSTLTDLFALTASGGHKAIGNADGNIPLSNGTVNTNLNADKLDGKHASDFIQTSDQMISGKYGKLEGYKGEDGWHRIATIDVSSSRGYGSHILYLTGSWNNKQNTNAIIHINTSHTTGKLTQVSGHAGFCNKIRLVNISSNQFYVDIHIKFSEVSNYLNLVPGSTYYYFLGNGNVTINNEVEKITSAVTAASEITLVTSEGNVFTSGNYTTWINTTNFPGLNSVGDITGVTAGAGLSGGGTSGSVTLTNAGVRSTTISGDYLRVNTNGTNTDLTIPYATLAGKLQASSNTIKSTTDDTTAKWGALHNTVHFYSTEDQLTDQPSQYGLVVNFNNSGSEVHQLWLTQSSGDAYHRGGNSAGWNGTWRKFLDSVNTHIKNGVITINGTSITPLTSHQSLANYVTLATAQTITGVKTFANSIIINSGLSITDEGGNGVLGIKSTTWTGIPSDAISLGTLKNSLYFRSNGDNMYHYRDDKGAAYKVLDASNYSSYALPLTGGTITGTLQIRRDAAAIQYCNSSGTAQGWLGFSAVDTPKVWMSNGSTSYTLWHTGNLTKVSQLTNDSGFITGGPYLPISGGTMTLGEGLKFHSDENYFGTNLDARIISLLDGNGTTCDGGLIIDERATYNGTETITELLRIRDSEFKWKGGDILHAHNYSSFLGNTYVMSGVISYNASERKFTANKTDNAWNAHAYSRTGYSAGCSISFKPSLTSTYIMVGLNSDPASDASYSSIDYCWYIQSNGVLCIYESGAYIATSKISYEVGDDFRITYDGSYVRYWCNGVLYRTVYREISGKLYFDSSFHNSGSIYDVLFDLVITYTEKSGQADFTNRLYANSISNLTTYPGDYSLSYSRFQSNASNIFPVNNNANGCITAHLHNGNYFAQIGLSSNGRMYYRTMMGQTLDSGVAWNRVAFTSDIPTSLPANGGNADTLDGYHAGVTNDSVSIYVSFPSWTTLKTDGYINSNYGNDGYGYPDEEFLKGICKWAIATYPNQGDVTLMGAIGPNSSGTCILHLYSSSGKDSTTKLPRYCRGQYLTLGGNLYHFGTYDYVWSYNRFAFASELKNPSNYYWANVKISSSSSTTTTPTFGLVTSAGLVTSGSINITGTAAETAHIKFNRSSYNYITFPSDGSLAFGTDVGSVNTRFRMTTDALFPETNDSVALGTSSNHWSNIYSTSANIYGDVYLHSGNEDRFLYFMYSGGNAYSWRIGYLGTGSGNANYLVIQSAKAAGTSWNNVIRIGNETLDAAFGGNVYPLVNDTQTLGTSSLRWSNIYSVSGNYSGDLTLCNSSAGDSPHLVFYRGTTSDGAYDWRIYDTGGYLKFQYCNADVWTEILSLYSNGVTSPAFIKSGSSDSYVLLGGGGHKAVSDFAASNASFTLGSTSVSLGSTCTSITGPFAVKTSASADKAFSIQRTGASEGVKHWVDDLCYYIDYQNDEGSSKILYSLANSNTESGGTPAATVSFEMNSNGYFYAKNGGFVKSGSSDSYVLLGGGGHKAVSDFATASSLDNYLPRTGGTLTGPVEIKSTSSGNYNEGLRISVASNNWAGITFGSTGLAGAPTNGWFAALNPSDQFIISPNDSSNTTGLTLNAGGDAKWRNNTLLHTGNYSSTLDGRYYTETEADNRFVNVAGDTMTGVLTMNTGTGIQMKYTSKGNDPWIYANGAPNYGIRYFEGDTDKMALSASGNNNNTSTADLCINGNGEGTVTIRGNTIIHAGNIGSQSVNYANSAGNANTVDGVHLEWAGSQAASNTEWLAGWTADGTKIKAVKRVDISVNNLNRLSGGFTVSSAGWYKLAKYESSDPRGSVRLALITVGGNYTPRYTEVKFSEGWSSIVINQNGKFDWISEYRYTTDGSNCYIEAYFKSACTFTLYKLAGTSYVDDSSVNWILYSTATSGSGTVLGSYPASPTSNFYSNGLIASIGGFHSVGYTNDYVLLAGGGHKLVSDFAAASGVVTALGTNGNYVTWTKNGTANNLTVPYATKAGTLDCFTKRVTANCTWGTLTASNGYTPIYWGDSASGGGIGFSDKGGQTFMQIDGDYYANEGTNLVLHTGNYNSYAPTLTGTGASGTWGINITGSANSLTTARTITLSGDFTGSTSFDGSSNVTIAAYNKYCSAYKAGVNNKPYCLIAQSGTSTGSWTDESIILDLEQGYINGSYGRVKIELRTENVSSGHTGSGNATWIFRKGFSADSILIGIRNTSGATYVDVFYKCPGTYSSITVRQVGGGARGSVSPTFTLINSSETSSASSNCWDTIANAATALHNQTYTSIVNAVDDCIVSYANSAGSASASDVYAWAKQPTKPSYSFSEITPGVATIGDGANRVMFRTHASYKSGMYYSTPGNESMVFGNVNSVTSWIFATTDPTANTDWRNLTPSLQIKNKRVTINKLIADGTDASYNLDVNGSANATTLYENGTRVSVSGHTHSYLSAYGEGSTASVRTADYTVALCTGGWSGTDKGYGSLYGTTLDVSGYSTWYNRLAFRTDGVIEYWQGINTKTLRHVGRIPICSFGGPLEIGRYLDFHYTDSSTNDYDVRIDCAGNSKNTLYLPAITGLVVVHTNDTAIGSTTKPVYIAATGQATVCSYEIGCVKAAASTSATNKYLLGVTAAGYLWAYYHTAAYVNSNGVFWSSDRRLKDNIKSPVKNGMLNDETGLIRKFTWKDSGNASYGFIAQELMLHIPEAVDYDETLNKYSVNYDVAHSALIAQLVIKVKELESEISKLKQLIN